MKRKSFLFFLIYSAFLIEYVYGTGFFMENWVQKNYSPPSVTNPLENIPITYDITVSVNGTDTINKVLETIFGNNLPAWRKNLKTSKEAERHLKNIKITTLRIPGGNWTNNWLWDGQIHWTLKDNYKSNIKSEPTTTWTLQTDDLLDLVSKYNSEPQICVNYSLARYIDEPNPVEKAASYAAGWVRYIKSLGIKARYWEVGNENYGSWQEGYIVDGDTITGAEYAQDFRIFADSMKAADPKIKVGAVLYPTSTNLWTNDWSIQVLKNASDKIDYVIIHEYFTWAPNLNTITPEEVLSAKYLIKADIDSVNAMLQAILGKTIEDIPVAMTEYNMRAGKSNTTGVATLFISEALGEFIKNKYGLVNLWDIENSSGFDDHGILTYEEAPTPDDVPHPSFFAYYYYRQTFGDVMVSSSSSDSKVFTYASRFSNGYLSLVIVNEDGVDKNVKLDFTNFNPGTKLYMYEVYYDSLKSRKIYINGLTSPNGELYGPRDYDSIPPYEIEIGSGDIVVPIKKYSANFIVVEPDKIMTGVKRVRLGKGKLYVKNYPNPFNPITTIEIYIPRDAKIHLGIYDINGKLVKELVNDKVLKSGVYKYKFNAKGLSSGVYFIKFAGNGFNIIKRMVLLK